MKDRNTLDWDGLGHGEELGGVEGYTVIKTYEEKYFFLLLLLKVYSSFTPHIQATVFSPLIPPRDPPTSSATLNL